MTIKETKSDNVTVSIFMITYNHERYIAQALESVFMQKTKFDFEIVIGEDCSSDGTRQIVKEYEKKYPQLIHAIYQKQNVGAMRNAFEFTLPLCKGRYIAWLEGDDYWTDPYKLQKQVDFLELNPEFVIDYHNAKTIDAGNNVLLESQLPDDCKRDFSSIELKRGAYLLPLSLCFRNVIKEYPDELYKVKNGDTFLIGLLGQYGKGKYIEDIEPAVYRVHQRGIWSSASPRLKIKYHRNTFKHMAIYFFQIGDTETGVFYNDLVKHRTSLYLFESLSRNRILDIFMAYTYYFWDFKVYKNLKQFVYLNKRVVKHFLTNIIQ